MSVVGAYDVVFACLQSVTVELRLAGAGSCLQRHPVTEVDVASLGQYVHRAFESSMCQRVTVPQHLFHVYQSVVLCRVNATSSAHYFQKYNCY